jgi:hypothetical protein
MAASAPAGPCACVRVCVTLPLGCRSATKYRVPREMDHCLSAAHGSEDRGEDRDGCVAYRYRYRYHYRYLLRIHPSSIIHPSSTHHLYIRLRRLDIRAPLRCMHMIRRRCRVYVLPRRPRYLAGLPADHHLHPCMSFHVVYIHMTAAALPCPAPMTQHSSRLPMSSAAASRHSFASMS